MTHPIALQELLDTIECGEEHDTNAEHLAAIKQAAKAVQATPPLHDWFAGQALVGLLVGYEGHSLSIKEYSQLALEAADAMLTQREVKP